MINVKHRFLHDLRQAAVFAELLCPMADERVEP
jgi:hypothetical protein